MCQCTNDGLCSVCNGRISVYKYMVAEWERTNPKPCSINIDEFKRWSVARDRALVEYQNRTGLFKI